MSMIRKRTPRELLEQNQRIKDLNSDLVLRDYGYIDQRTKYANGHLDRVFKIVSLYCKVYSAQLLSFGAKRRLFEDWGMDCNPDMWENDLMPTERKEKRKFLWDILRNLQPSEINKYREDLEHDLDDDPTSIKELLEFIPDYF